MPEYFASTFSLVMPISHESELTKLMTSLVINFLLAVFYGQSLSCEVIYKSQGDLNSSNSKYFPSSQGLSSNGGSTRTAPEKVHAVPLTRKALSFSWLRRNLSVFLGSVFS